MPPPQGSKLRWREDMEGSQTTNNSIKYTLLAIYTRMELMRGWVATIYYMHGLGPLPPKKKG